MELHVVIHGMIVYTRDYGKRVANMLKTPGAGGNEHTYGYFKSFEGPRQALDANAEIQITRSAVAKRAGGAKFDKRYILQFSDARYELKPGKVEVSVALPDADLITPARFAEKNGRAELYNGEDKPGNPERAPNVWILSYLDVESAKLIVGGRDRGSIGPVIGFHAEEAADPKFTLEQARNHLRHVRNAIHRKAAARGGPGPIRLDLEDVGIGKPELADLTVSKTVIKRWWLASLPEKPGARGKKKKTAAPRSPSAERNPCWAYEVGPDA